jgi:ubiquinone/menaquinone biosynthesis C-methylase UbiE
MWALSGKATRRLEHLATREDDSGAKILNVGCGTGSLVHALAPAAPSATITGFDFSQAYIDFARSRAVAGRVTLRTVIR